MKNKAKDIFHAVGTVPKPIRVTQINDLPFSWLGTDTSMKSGGV